MSKKIETTMLCNNPNCRKRVYPMIEPRGDLGIGILLCLLFLPIGIIYFIFKSGYKYICPYCNTLIYSDGA